MDYAFDSKSSFNYISARICETQPLKSYLITYRQLAHTIFCEGGNMAMIRKTKFFHSLLILSTMIMIGSMSFGIAAAADNSKIVINKTLKPGMALTDAMVLLGPPDTIKEIETGTVLMPYDSIGLSIETMSGGTVIEAIHIKSAFKGKFSSGLGIGSGFQEILSAYDQPDIMTKEIIEYSNKAMVFQISQGKLVGADLYAGGSALFHPMSNKKAGMHVTQKNEKYAEEIAEPYEDEEIDEYEDVAAAPDVAEEDEIDEYEEDKDEDAEANNKYDVFDLYGFKVKIKDSKVVITEIRPGSVAEKGGLKVGEPVRKISYKGLSKRNVYTSGGLKSILKRAVNKRKKYVNILQDEHYYYRVRVPRR